MTTVIGPGTILGGLPVIVEIDCGHDSFAGERYSEVREIYWRRRNGSKGKPIAQKVRDRAESYDAYFDMLQDEVFDNLREKEAGSHGDA